MGDDAITRGARAVLHDGTNESDLLIEELQRAAEEHRRILDRQAELIGRLREELKDVKRQ